jgi:hypothetical protein
MRNLSAGHIIDYDRAGSRKDQHICSEEFRRELPHWSSLLMTIQTAASLELG